MTNKFLKKKHLKSLNNKLSNKLFNLINYLTLTKFQTKQILYPYQIKFNRYLILKSNYIHLLLNLNLNLQFKPLLSNLIRFPNKQTIPNLYPPPLNNPSLRTHPSSHNSHNPPKILVPPCCPRPQAPTCSHSTR